MLTNDWNNKFVGYVKQMVEASERINCPSYLRGTVLEILEESERMGIATVI